MIFASYIPWVPIREEVAETPTHIQYDENRIFNRYLTLVPQDNFDQIPEVNIKGTNIDPLYSRLSLKRLSATSPFSPIIGEIVDNCELLPSIDSFPTTVYIGGA